MSYFVVLNHKKELIPVKEDWIQYPILHTESKCFYSPDEKTSANFELDEKYFFKKNEISCYKGFICKRFGKYLL